MADGGFDDFGWRPTTVDLGEGGGGVTKGWESIGGAFNPSVEAPGGQAATFEQNAAGKAAFNPNEHWSAFDAFMGKAIPAATTAVLGGGLGAAFAGAGAGAGGLVGGAEGGLGAVGGGSLAGGELAGGGLDLVGGATGGLGGVPSGFAGGGGGDITGAPDITGAGGGTSFIDATTPTVPLSPETMQVLGISPAEFAGGGESSFTLPETGATGAGFVPGGGDAGFAGGADGGLGGVGGGSMASDPDYLQKAAALWKKLGISPGTALQLGMAGKNALTTPKLPEAAKTLQNQAGPGAQAAMQVIQSGGQGSPAWAAQKQSIDAGIDQQVQEQTQAIMQNAVNSGMGADSQVVVQQVNKLKTQLETQRQALYAQAQQQNVQSALQSLGIQDAALANVANAQFRQSDEAKASASATAQNALMLQALSRGTQKQPETAETDG